MLIGETGTGKELAARALHELSGRTGRLISVNGALLHPERAESDLFGHIPGAFTGADKDKARDGRIREASGGTFFLDEMGDVPGHVQAQLLRATANVERAAVRVVPMGEEDARGEDVNVRFVSALQREPEEGDLRQDLYHRLSWLRIGLPPLRERIGDAVVIAKNELATLNEKFDGPSVFSKELIEALGEKSYYSWPGNVRELRRVVFSAWFFARRDKQTRIDVAHMQPHLRREAIDFTPTGNLRGNVAHYVVQVATRALKENPGSKKAAAESLGFKTGQELERYVGTHEKNLDA